MRPARVRKENGMRWTPGGRSDNLEDRRSEGGGGFGGLPRVGLGGIVVLLVLSLIFKRDLLTPFLGSGGAGQPNPEATAEENAAEEPEVQFVSFVLDDAQATWTRILPTMGRQYQPARLVLFRDAINSACGFAQAATGPFYCPLDQRVYIDLGFYQELKTRFGAPGDFAQAYVLAHEIGHHVQELLGTGERVRRAQQAHPEQANELSVRLELQADCYAGVWGNSTEQRQLLDPGDVEEGIKAAGAVGDDRIQRMSTGRVNPDAFTHGTSEQRVAWFRRGYESGRPDACDTFASAR
jgi:predicted metalloprotease